MKQSTNPPLFLSQPKRANEWRISFIEELIEQIALKESRLTDMPWNNTVDMILRIIAHDMLIGSKTDTDEIEIFKLVLCGCNA